MDKILAFSGNSDNTHETDILSVDGKESRRSGRKHITRGAVKALQILNVHSNNYEMCLAQKFIHEKTNGISTAQEVLGLMDLKGSIVTADAMNCQKETAEIIIKSKGNYVLCLK